MAVEWTITIEGRHLATSGGRSRQDLGRVFDSDISIEDG